MEKCGEAAAAKAPSQRVFPQVAFIDVPPSYPPATPVTCCYTVTAFQPSNKDWVGVFKLGWTDTRDYHTYVWVDPCQDLKGDQSEIRKAVFSDYYLPKDETEFYRFCYVDGAGQLRGASTPFRFRKSKQQNAESRLDDNLLIVTTQEQMEQNTRAKDEMQKELDQLMEENESLKSALEEEEQVSASLQRQNEQKEKENAQLVEELDQIKQGKENSNMPEQQLKEMEHLKAELAEAHRVIADKVAIIEERDRWMATFCSRERNLALLNEELIIDLELLCRNCAELRVAPPAGSPRELQRDTTVDANGGRHPEMSGQSGNLCAMGDLEGEQLC